MGLDSSTGRWTYYILVLFHEVPVRCGKYSLITLSIPREADVITVTFKQTYFIVETGAIFTYLVFHHALRIRFKSDLLKDDKDKEKDKYTKANDSATESAVDTPATMDTDSATTVGIQEASESSANADTASVAGEPQEGKAQERTTNLAGRINNLITADLAMISNCHDVVTLRMPSSPLPHNIVD